TKLEQETSIHEKALYAAGSTPEPSTYALWGSGFARGLGFSASVPSAQGVREPRTVRAQPVYPEKMRQLGTVSRRL
ncbi:MAG: hypothetical protein LBS59_03640, partial [Puniceicoccales bacterium]|nr:hypothetical protein [Puniceicoccales bacterium]